jgi:hypothetical protein
MTYVYLGRISGQIFFSPLAFQVSVTFYLTLEKPNMRISETVRTAANQDGAVLMDIALGQMYSINPCGARILQQLNDGRSPEEIAETFVTDFGISREQALTDICEFVQQLEVQQLIRSSESQDVPEKLAAGSNGLVGKLLRWRNLHPRHRSFPETKTAGNTESR